MCSERTALAAWGLEHARVSPLAGGTANRNLLVEEGDRRYFLRQRSPRYVAPAQIAFDHAFMRHLAAHGVRGPNPIPTNAGEMAVRVGDAVYELHTYLSGRPVDWHNVADLRIAGRALRRFHEAAASFQPPVTKAWSREDAPEDIRRGLAELREVVSDASGRAVLDALRCWADRIEEALPDKTFWALPCQVVHGDFHPGNVHVTGDELGIFDLDCASHQPRARDLADGVLYFCARRDGPFDASTIVRLTRECWLEKDRELLFLEAYGPIRLDERAALPYLVAARWIYSRVRGRIKLSRDQWPVYIVQGVLTPLAQLEQRLITVDA